MKMSKEEVLDMYGSFEEASKQSAKYSLEKQCKYEKTIINKLSKCRFSSDSTFEVTSLAQLEGRGCPWHFSSYKSKTNFGMSTLIKSLERTAVWTKFLDLKDWNPDSDKLALVFSCPSNGYNDLVILGSKPKWIESVAWYVSVNKVPGNPVYILTLKNMLDQI